MKDNERKQFIALMAGLGEYYGKTISSAILQIYWTGLKRFPYSDIEKAAGRLIEGKTFNKMPLVAEFIELITDSDNRTFAAIKSLESKFHDNGYSSVVFKDPIIHYVIHQMGGWIRVCEETARMNDRDYNYWKSNFERQYRALLKSPPTDREVPRLIGTEESGQRSGGWLIGNELHNRTGAVIGYRDYADDFNAVHGDYNRKLLSEGDDTEQIGEIDVK